MKLCIWCSRPPLLELILQKALIISEKPYRYVCSVTSRSQNVNNAKSLVKLIGVMTGRLISVEIIWYQHVIRGIETHDGPWLTFRRSAIQPVITRHRRELSVLKGACASLLVECFVRSVLRRASSGKSGKTLYQLSYGVFISLYLRFLIKWSYDSSQSTQ